MFSNTYCVINEITRHTNSLILNISGETKFVNNLCSAFTKQDIGRVKFATVGGISLDKPLVDAGMIKLLLFLQSNKVRRHDAIACV